MAVYFIQEVGEPKGLIKIGKALDVSSRLWQHRYETGKDLTVLGVIDGYTELERELHKRFKRYRVSRSEWFEPAQPILDFIATRTRPFENIPPRKCTSFNRFGEQCDAYVMEGSDYCVSHHPDFVRVPQPTITVQMEGSIMKQSKKKAGIVPFPAIVRALLGKWVNGEVELNLDRESN